MARRQARAGVMLASVTTMNLDRALVLLLASIGAVAGFTTPTIPII
jgi:hypothetical protein